MRDSTRATDNSSMELMGRSGGSFFGNRQVLAQPILILCPRRGVNRHNVHVEIAGHRPLAGRLVDPRIQMMFDLGELALRQERLCNSIVLAPYPTLLRAASSRRHDLVGLFSEFAGPLPLAAQRVHAGAEAEEEAYRTCAGDAVAVVEP